MDEQDGATSGRAAAVVWWVMQHQDKINAVGIGALQFEWGVGTPVRPRLTEQFPKVEVNGQSSARLPT